MNKLEEGACSHEAEAVEDESDLVVCRRCGEWTSPLICPDCGIVQFQSACCA